MRIITEDFTKEWERIHTTSHLHICQDLRVLAKTVVSNREFHHIPIIPWTIVIVISMEKFE